MKPSASEQTTVTELLLVGGGHSHVAVIRHFGMHPLPGVRVTVVSRDVHTPYSGMLPGLIAGHYAFDDCHIDLRALCAATGARFIHGTVTSIDRSARRVGVQDRAPLAYDWLSLNTGSTPALAGIPGAVEHGISVKPIDTFLDRWHAALADLCARPRPLRIAIVGGGAAGVEVALACDHALGKLPGDAGAMARIDLFTASSCILPMHNGRVRRYFSRKLEQRGIGVQCARRVQAADAEGLDLGEGSRHAADLVIWALQAGAATWPQESGLPCDAAGFVRVDETLRVLGEERIFAAGDLAALPEPVAKSGVYAVREGKLMAQNLERAIRGLDLRRYHPQRRFLALLTTGPRHAVASRGAFFAAGDWVWRWKNRIDRAFMAMYRVRPVIAPTGESPMRCGGCAAKVGSEALSGALCALPQRHAEGIVSGLDGRDDAAVIQPPPGVQLVQSVDYFRAFLDDPWLLGRIGAVHALGDLHAMGARPHSALAIATIPFAAPGIVQETLAQLMQGAQATLDEEGVVLLGGHSNEGVELAFGLSVNGFAAPGEILRKSGIADGDCLVITKPLGTGVLLAANMAAAAEGRWIEAAIQSMQHSNRDAIAVLRAHGASACTDITGFGLLGHLLEMLRDASVGLQLRIDALPALPGALDCLRRGWRSSLAQDNAKSLAALTNGAGADAHILALLTDPQTAGGLLAAVPAHQAEDCVQALRRAAFADAALVGHASAAVPAGKVLLA